MNHNETDKAIALFKGYAERFSESPRFHHDLGNAYLQNNETQKAKAAFTKAVSLAKAQNDHNYDLYVESLEKL